MKKKKLMVLLAAMLFILMMSMTASAKWVSNGAGSYDWYNKAGAKCQSTYFPEKKAGIANVNGTWYGIKNNNKVYKGFMTTNTARYYFDKKGRMVRNKFFKANKHLYYADAEGKLPKFGVKQIGNARYGFSGYGYALFGQRTLNGNTYYFDKKTAQMVFNRTIKIGKYYFHFGEDGTMYKSKEFGRYFFMKSGRMAKNTWINSQRYYGSNGQYYTGLKKISKRYYYFDPNTGIKVVNANRVVNGKTYAFDATGIGHEANTGEITLANGVRVEASYKTDPVVSDEQLLAAIIDAESANQPLYGQIAVGMVIINRVRSHQFPNNLKEVIYQDQQFEPTRNVTLTNRLKNPALVTAQSRQAAKTVLERTGAGNFKVCIKSKWTDMKDYLYFMTPAAYTRLGLKASTLRIDGHVFFKTWS